MGWAQEDHAARRRYLDEGARINVIPASGGVWFASWGREGGK